LNGEKKENHKKEQEEIKKIYKMRMNGNKRRKKREEIGALLQDRAIMTIEWGLNPCCCLLLCAVVFNSINKLFYCVVVLVGACVCSAISIE
jgi:hypothetical protein